MSRRFRLLATVIGLQIGLLLVPMGPASATPVEDGRNCVTHNHTTTEHAIWCASVEFDDVLRWVNGMGQLVALEGSRPAGTALEKVDIMRVAIYRTNGPSWVLLDEIGDLGSTVTQDTVTTGSHGPFRCDQQYYASMTGRVRWSDGQLSPIYTINSLRTFGNNHNCAA
jgi:hypothetical protein